MHGSDSNRWHSSILMSVVRGVQACLHADALVGVWIDVFFEDVQRSYSGFVNSWVCGRDNVAESSSYGTYIPHHQVTLVC